MIGVSPIRTEAEYAAGLKEIEQYFEKGPVPGIPEADRFDVLAALIKTYEDEHWAIEAPETVEAIKEVMSIRGYSQRDLAVLLGSAPRASEILNRTRCLTMDQARTPHKEWGIP